MKGLLLTVFVVVLAASYLQCGVSHGVQPLSKIAIHKTKVSLHSEASIKVSPSLLGVSFSQLAHLLSFILEVYL